MKIVKSILVCGAVVLAGAISGHFDALNPVSKAYSAAAKMPSELFSYVQTSAQLKQKLADAKLAHKPAMIEFFATWCPYCKALDRDVLSSEDIQKQMAAFATIRVDVSVNNQELNDMMDEYHVNGVPTLIFYDKNGVLFNTDAYFNEGISKNDVMTVLRKLA